MFYQLLRVSENFNVISIIRYLQILILSKYISNDGYSHLLPVKFSYRKANYLP